MKSLNDLGSLKNKIVLLRLDLNTPLNQGKITDTTRIDKILPTINYLLKNDAKIIIISHIGRPNGEIIKALSLQTVCESLQKKINQSITLVKENIKNLNNNNLFKNKDEKILMFENIRFYKEEEKSDKTFAKHIAGFADIYVNDAFSCSHRNHASITQIPKFLPSYIGLQFFSELTALKKLTSNIKKPVTCIIGGSKISTKINIIENLATKFNNIVVVGGMANNIFKYQNYEIGKSIYEKNCEKNVERIFLLSKKYNCKITTPLDVLTGKDMSGESEIKSLKEIDKNDYILDIGPKTIKKIIDIIEQTKTILWNGPAGYFENPNFAIGSVKIANFIAQKNKEKGIYSVAGGGDTVSLLNSIKLTNNFNFVSTAGGAFLEYLEGKSLPGISALN